MSDVSPIILYHDNCLDGAVAALVIRNCLLSEGATPLTYAVQYGKPAPVADYKNADVYIVDFSYDVATTKMIAERASSVVVLDHHVTAIDRFEDEAGHIDEYTAKLFAAKCEFIFDKERSGASLAWEYTHDPDNRPESGRPYLNDKPWYVAHTADRDLWKFELRGTNAVVKGLFPYIGDLDSLQGAIDLGREAAHTQGVVLQAADSRMVDALVETAHRGMIAGHNVPCANSPHVISELGNVLAADEPFAVIYHVHGTLVRVSLRSTDEGLDVAKIAEKFGGGGHRNAAGFTTTPAELLQAITR